MSQNTNFPVNIVYQDEHFIAVNKPSGLLCVPGLREPDNLVLRLQEQFSEVRVVHRLDMATSGLVLFALHYDAQKGLSKLFEQRLIQKSYIAVVHGLIEDQSGEIHSPMICDWPNRPRQKIDWINGKMGSTHFQVLTRSTDKNCTRLLLTPYTGRSHQLRIHMLQLGHPILGDDLYFPKHISSEAPRLLLHAQQLQFKHPMTQQEMDLSINADF